mmetsp:Transcript_15617/g.42064  ORF Transcript_15617/g.42064 Transcript_15617/m.42064 type:complete len:85 (+) Transcript_15617:2046-2300(+)
MELRDRGVVVVDLVAVRTGMPVGASASFRDEAFNAKFLLTEGESTGALLVRALIRCSSYGLPSLLSLPLALFVGSRELSVGASR